MNVPVRSGADVITNAKSVVESAARELLRALATLPSPPTLRVANADGPVACLIQVWGAGQVMPTANSERRNRSTGGRDECRADILAVVTAAGQARTRKEIVRELKARHLRAERTLIEDECRDCTDDDDANQRADP